MDLPTEDSFHKGTASIGVVGLGYIGTPLLVALRRCFSVYGYDRDAHRVRELRHGADWTRSSRPEELRSVSRYVTTDASVLRRCRFIIITVPTPTKADCAPDLDPLKDAARTVGEHLAPGTAIVVESTVYPGVTEDVVGPILSRRSGLKAGEAFHLGYSPERMNPGDRKHSLEAIPKVVAGDSPAVTELMAAIYGTVAGGVHRAASIKTAEAAKVLENTQRDLNIALINEAAMIFHRLGVDTQEVIRTASTKWNFVPVQPGLVGGHCVATDPYYLAHVAEQNGCPPDLIRAGRQVNDAVGYYVAERTAELIRSNREGRAEGARALVLGFTFKEDVPDTRNTRVADMVGALETRRIECSVFDPEADPGAVREQYGLNLLAQAERNAPYDAVVLAVRHSVFASRFPVPALRALAVPERPVLVDVKSAYDRGESEAAGFTYWRL